MLVLTAQQTAGYASKPKPDPHEEPIEADMSREDLIVLHQECVGKHVVEVGSGGSTLYLARIADSLCSYETAESWIDLVRNELEQREDPHCEVSLLLDPCPEPTPPVADVYFIDGLVYQRETWLNTVVPHHARTVLVHDSRAPDIIPTMSVLLRHPGAMWIESVHYHYLNSNMVVIRLREKPVRYEDWNTAETTGRAPQLHERER